MRWHQFGVSALCLALLLTLAPDASEAKFFGALGRGLASAGRGLARGAGAAARGIGRGFRGLGRGITSFARGTRNAFRVRGASYYRNMSPVQLAQAHAGAQFRKAIATAVVLPLVASAVAIPAIASSSAQIHHSSEVGDARRRLATVLDLLQYSYCQIQPLEQGATAIWSDLERQGTEKFDQEMFDWAQEVADAYKGTVDGLDEMSQYDQLASAGDSGPISAARCSEPRFRRGAAPEDKYGLGARTKEALEKAARTEVVQSATSYFQANDALSDYSRTFNYLTLLLQEVKAKVGALEEVLGPAVEAWCRAWGMHMLEGRFRRDYRRICLGEE